MHSGLVALKPRPRNHTLFLDKLLQTHPSHFNIGRLQPSMQTKVVLLVEGRGGEGRGGGLGTPTETARCLWGYGFLAKRCACRSTKMPIYKSVIDPAVLRVLGEVVVSCGMA